MIELRQVSRQFGASRALDRISLDIPGGSFTALLGPSGCGKSTTLRLIAGLDHPTEGEILFGGRDVSRMTAAERNIAMVFQSYALYPHMSVAANIALPLAMRRKSVWQRLPLADRVAPSARRKSTEIMATVREVAAMLEIEALLDRKPNALSGGQKQRVAVARALVRDPVAFLLDEPLSNLDAKLRVQMRGELVDLHRRTGKTFVYVTHDQAEAMSMADRVALIMAGRLVQIGTPRDIYRQPANRDVAAFIGDHPINMIELPVIGGRLAPPFQAFALDGSGERTRVALGIRPDAMQISDSGPLRGRLERLEYLGGESLARIGVAEDLQVQVLLGDDDPSLNGSDSFAIDLDPRRVHVFDADTGDRLPAQLVRLPAVRVTGLRTR